VIADGDAGRIPDVVAVGLERDAEHGHPPARQRAAHDFPGQLDDPVPAADVDGVHGGQQGDHGVHAQFGRGRAEAADVLGQAAAAVPKTRRQEPPADPRVVAERLRQRDYVGA